MRNMSFFHTQQQILDQTKTVTRRLGWKFLQSGDIVQPVVKGQGLKKGEKVKQLGCPIRIITVRREWLSHVRRPWEMYKEGFPKISSEEFMEMFRKINNLKEDVLITRIEFEYTEPKHITPAWRGRSKSWVQE